MTSPTPFLAPGGRHRICAGPPPPPPSIRRIHTSAIFLNYRKQLATQEGANEFLSSLTEVQRTHLNTALTRVDTENNRTGEGGREGGRERVRGRERERGREKESYFLFLRGGAAVVETVETS